MRSIIQCRSKMVDEYKKPSKYFLNLEKANQMKRNIRSLMYKGDRITNQEKILTIQREFYEKLYSQDSNHTLNEYINEFPSTNNISNHLTRNKIYL